MSGNTGNVDEPKHISAKRSSVAVFNGSLSKVLYSAMDIFDQSRTPVQFHNRVLFLTRDHIFNSRYKTLAEEKHYGRERSHILILSPALLCSRNHYKQIETQRISWNLSA